jgi:DNA-binding ferritin-like protein
MSSKKVKNIIINNNKRNLQKLEQTVVIKFLEMLNVVKIFHWKTDIFAIHTATDELYKSLNEHIDSFIEVLLGKSGGRIDLTKVNTTPLEDFTELSHFRKKIISYKKFLIDLNKSKKLSAELDSDLFNIRDEILGDLNQFLYLLTFR